MSVQATDTYTPLQCKFEVLPFHFIEATETDEN